MSQSPEKELKAGENSPYIEAWERLHDLIQKGQSWSGRERNCFFLNTGDGRFANISAVSGIDFPDDGRAVALVDWDADGDVDFWMANRTAPRIRFFKNETQNGNASLSLRLRGVKSNRDGIGARVDVRLEDGRILAKTLRAGEGFLAQSSKWLHFGLGEAQVHSLVVRWPGGSRENFGKPLSGGRLLLVEGSGMPAPLPPRPALDLPATPFVAPEVRARARIPLGTRVPLPALSYSDFEGQQATLVGTGKPQLLNLWASWCGPCLHELREFTEASEGLKAAGLDVVALSVDALGEEPEASLRRARKALKSMAFPFRSGLATKELLGVAQIIHDSTVDLHRPLPVPTSLLLDAEGKVAVLYVGTVSVERLLADLGSLSRPSSLKGDEVLPLVGRWAARPGPRRLLSLVADFLEEGLLDEALGFVLENRASLDGDASFAEVLGVLAHRLLREDRAAEALGWFREGLALDESLGWLHLGLASCLDALGQPDAALASYVAAVEANSPSAAAHERIAAKLLSEGQVQEAVQHLLTAKALGPVSAEMSFNLGLTLARLGRIEEALANLETAQKLAPDDEDTRKLITLLESKRRQ